MQQDRVRRDFLFRVKGTVVGLPPLAERREDLPLLIDYLMLRLGKKEGRSFTLSRSAREKLQRYPFPGNIRELDNLLTTAMLLGTGGELQIKLLEDASLSPAAEPESPWFGKVRTLDQVAPLDEVIDAYLQHVIQLAGGNHSLAARLAKVHRDTIWRRMKQGKAQKRISA